MPTPKELIDMLSESVLYSCSAAQLLGVPMNNENLQSIADASLKLMHTNYPNILPADGSIKLELCGNSCNCPCVILDKVFSAIIQRDLQPATESTFVDVNNNTLQ